MSTPAPRDGSVPLTAWDAYRLAALTEGSPKQMPIDLKTFVHDYDWLNRLIPDFDDLSYGLPRLEAAGYVVFERDPTKGLLLTPTPAAWALRRSYEAKTLGDVVVRMARELGVERELGEGDRSLGRLPGFEPEELDRAIAAYEREFDRDWRITRILLAPLMLALRIWLAVRSLIDRSHGIDRSAPDGDPRLVRLLPPTLGGDRVEGHGYVGIDMDDEELGHVKLLRRIGDDGSDTAQTFGFVADGEVQLSALRVGGVDGRGLIEPWLATFGELWVDPSAGGIWSEVEGQEVCLVRGEHVRVTLVLPDPRFDRHLAELVRHLVLIGPVTSGEGSAR